MNDVGFEALDYGVYEMVYPHGSAEPIEDAQEYTEAIRYASAEFSKIRIGKVRLPDGKNNLIYLLTDTFDHALEMLNGKNFVIPPGYRRVFYPYWYIGYFVGRRYVLSIDTVRKERDLQIKAKTKLMPYKTRVLQKTVENLFFVASDIYEIAKPFLQKASIARNYEMFYPDLMNALDGLTPERTMMNKGPNWDNRIMIIDAGSFAFKISDGLKVNKTNPLYLLYLAYFRKRDLSNMGVDIDMMICSKNLFLKFNPSKLTGAEWQNFRRALFRIMKADLDEYTDNLSPEEKAELEETAQDRIVTNVVNNTLEPYTKNLSTSTKTVLQNAVESKLRKEVAKTAAQDKEIKTAQAEIAAKIGVKPPEAPASKATPAAPVKPQTAVPVKPNEQKKDIFKASLPPSSRTPITRSNPAAEALTRKQERLFQAIGNNRYQAFATKTGLMVDDDEDFDKPDDMEEYEDEIATGAKDILVNDRDVAAEVLDEIQDQTVPMKDPKTAPVNSARDKKLREAQKQVVVGKETIEQILARDSSNVQIKTEDKSKVLHTSNANMKQIRFANFDKTYIDELYMKDIVACFDFLKDKESPFYVTDVEVRDTSTTLDFKDTWTVHLKDETGKRHTIKVDIPKFQNDRFMLINGTRFIILKQNFYNPLVKDTPDTVILTTNFNKITITRRATKSLTSIERIFSLIRKTGNSKMFMTGDSSKGNMKYLSSLEYDELSRRLFRFVSGNCEICFSRDYIRDNMSDQIPEGMKGNEFYIGYEGDIALLINEDTGLDRRGRTIADIIEQNLPANYKTIYNSIKAPTQSMYVEGKLAGEFIPIITTLIVWNGLSKTLDRMGMRWRFDPKAKRVPTSTSSTKYIRFADGVLEYQAKTYAELIMNGLMRMHPEQFKFEDFNSEVGYEEFIYSQWGSYSGITELRNFKEFLVDPITKTVCKDMMLPDDPSGLLIHAVKLLCDNAYVSKASDKSYRVRSIEMIPAILYSCLANQYKAHIKSGRRIPMTLNQRCVITKLMAEKTVEPYSTLNPVVEVSKTHTVSTKGYKGSNSDHSYDEEKRSYDPSAVGKLAISTSPDANVGINKVLVTEPTIANARGYRDQNTSVGDLKDVNVFSPVEMLTPGTARNDDPIRTAIAGKQSGHIVPVKDASPALISNGYDEVVQFHLSDDFVINAEEDGQVVEFNPEVGFLVVKYKSGKTRAITTNPEVVKNSGAGFFLANQMTLVHTKVGEKFKKDEPLAYHNKYFRYSKLNGLRFAIGPLVKMAFMSSYNTYEDAGICTETLAERMKTSIVYQEIGKFKKNNNILSIVKIGDHVNIGDTLIKFDVSVEDNELAKYLSKLNDENAALLSEESKSEIKTMHAGKVIAIKVYTLLDPKNLSPSLGAVVQRYFDQGTTKKKFLEKYDQSEGIMKAGYMLTDSTEPVKSRYNSIKGIKGIDVLIEIYIEHDDVMGVGDKVALYGPNKQIISEVIPKGYEPYSEFRPDEEISVMTSPGTIARRMTSSVLAISAAMKCMVELKRKIKSEIRYR